MHHAINSAALCWLCMRTLFEQGMELVKDRAALLQENERLWKELEQTKVALAVESTLRSNLLSGTSASAFHRAASIKYVSSSILILSCLSMNRVEHLCITS